MKYALNYKNNQFEKEKEMTNYGSKILDELEEQTLRYVAGFVLCKSLGLVKYKKNQRVKLWNNYFQCGVRKGNFQNIIQLPCLIIGMHG